MYYNDHLPPHFHAKSAEYEALIKIDTLTLLRGELPRRENTYVLKCAKLHREELKNNWERARQGLPLLPIAPLEQ